MPRKSVSQLEMEAFTANLPGGGAERPEPPAKMSTAAAAVWREVVASMKPRHFTPETWGLLTRYCNASALCGRLEGELARIDASALDHDRLTINSTAMTALSYARALRLTPKSNLETRGDARDPHRSVGPKPWELLDNYGNPQSSKRKLWLD